MSEKALPLRGLKQVKVDNWGTFFLQRLQQLYFEEQLLDLTIKFPTSDITVQAHRLVVTTCTNYFSVLEIEQKMKNSNFDGVIVMPTDMPYECVKSIISFMYTGQLEYWTSEQHALYRTAQKMNMTILTKLLDAQFNNKDPQPDSSPNERPVTHEAPTKSTDGSIKTHKTAPSNSFFSELPSQPLPGRKLPIWKRKIDIQPHSSSMDYDTGRSHNTSLTHHNRTKDPAPGPSRFDLPEADDFTLGMFSSFDDITYNTKPIVRADDQFNRSNPSPNSLDHKNSNKNDSDNDDEESQEPEKSLREVNSDDDWASNRYLKRSQDMDELVPSKKVRFDFEEKENLSQKQETSFSQSKKQEDSISNHAKIIKEVLKKYPHLVKNNKNIRLKIMQKESKSSETSSKTKVSYVVLKSDNLIGDNGESNDSKLNGTAEGTETGPWKCHKCDLDEYTNYYMYRRHMQDVHEEKFDPRVCEHCGYKAAKRNILMYHLYTKHDVPPPKSMNFPKCQACSYVALSEILLVKHQMNHNHGPIAQQSSNSDELECGGCSQTFKNMADLTTHELNTGHGDRMGSKYKGHRCVHCGKLFVRANNLKVHIDCAHKDLKGNLSTSSNISQTSKNLPMEEDREGEDDSNSHITEYIMPDMDLNDAGHDSTGQMIMLIDGQNYQRDHQSQQLEITDNNQIVMQGANDGMIVYIQGNELAMDHRMSYDSCDTEEIVEEVVEEVEEEVEEEIIEEEEEEEEEEEDEEDEEEYNNDDEHDMDEDEEDSRHEQNKRSSSVSEDCNDEQIEEVIQYVEEQTEIVEYDEEQCDQRGNNVEEMQESLMIIEEQHVEEDEADENKSNNFSEEWAEDNVTNLVDG